MDDPRPVSNTMRLSQRPPWAEPSKLRGFVLCVTALGCFLPQGRRLQVGLAGGRQTHSSIPACPRPWPREPFLLTSASSGGAAEDKRPRLVGSHTWPPHLWVSRCHPSSSKNLCQLFLRPPTQRPGRRATQTWLPARPGLPPTSHSLP